MVYAHNAHNKTIYYDQQGCIITYNRIEIRFIAHKAGTTRCKNYLDSFLPEEATQTYTLFPLQNQHHPPINIVPSINGQEVLMKLDTGAAISVINEVTYKTNLAHQPTLKKSTVNLHTYSGEQLKVLRLQYSGIIKQCHYH